jgi:phage tail-like protein
MASAPTAPQGQQSGAQPGVFIDPFRSYHFKLVIQGVTEGHFIECSNISIKVQALRYREGGQTQVVHRLPGPVEYGDITLRYGLTRSMELWNWFKAVVDGKPDRRNVSIVLLETDDTTEALRWDLVNAWPSSWRGAPLDAMAKEVAIEELVLVFETLDRA